MKAGLTIEELATEIMRQRDAKSDYIVNASRLCMENYGGDIVLRVLDEDNSDRIEPLDIGDIAHRQIGTRLGIPSKYYSKMLSEHPELLVTNVNACAYWPEGAEYDENVTPLCSSVDGKVGHGAPGGVCAACALNQYGSDPKGKGKAYYNHVPFLLFHMF